MKVPVSPAWENDRSKIEGLLSGLKIIKGLESKKLSFWLSVSLILLVFLFWVYSRNSLLFHATSEIFSIVIASGIFFIIWNSANILDNYYFLILSIALLYAAGFDTLSILGYEGITIFSSYKSNPFDLTMQLWVSAKLTIVSAFIIGPYFIKRKFNKYRVLGIYTTVFLIIILLIFEIRNFPIRISSNLLETKALWGGLYILMLNIGMVQIFKDNKYFSPQVFKPLIVSILVMITSAILFILSNGSDGVVSFASDYFKVISYLLLYISIVVIGVREPQKVLFREISQSRERALNNQRSLSKVAERLKVENVQKETILKRIREGIVMTNSSGIVKYSSDSFKKMFNKYIDIGNISNLVSSIYVISGKKRTRLDMYLDKKISDDDIEVICSYDNDVSSKFYRIYISTITSQDKAIGNIFIFRDISSQLESERIKSNLISFASHQMKTPLSVLLLTLNELMIEAQSLSTKSLTKEAINKALTLERIVDTFLDVSRLESGLYKINPEQRDISLVVDEVFESYLPRAMEKNVNMVKGYAHSYVMKVDKEALMTVIESLMDNAIKYVPEGGTVRIEINKNKEFVEITIMNNGPRIPEASISKIFKKRGRANIGNNKQGFGIGLYLVKLLTDAFGGSVYVESPIRKPYKWLRAGEGASFSIRLPMEGMKGVGKIS